MLKNQFLKSEITLYPPYMSVERVGISKKKWKSHTKKVYAFFVDIFPRTREIPPRVGFPPHFTAPQGGGISARGGGIPPPQCLIGGGFPPHPLHPIKNFHMTTKTITTPVTVTVTVTIWIVSDSVSNTKSESTETAMLSITISITQNIPQHC